MLPTPLLLFLFLASTNAQRFFRTTPENIKPASPNYKPPTAPKNNIAPPKPAAVQQEQVIANNVGGLNKALRTVIEAIDLGTQLADAILATSQTNPLQGTPTATINATYFAPCRAYASLLSSCASATPSFYDLGPLAQASCACYTASTDSAACTAAPTLDASYDTYEAYCYEFFDYYGYQRIAAGMNESSKLPGPDLCSWAQESFSMAATLAAKTVECKKASPSPTPSVAAQRVGDGASELLTAFDRGVLGVFMVSVTALSWGVFLL